VAGNSVDVTQNVAMTQYTVDAQMSRFTLQAFAAGLLSAVGHNPTFVIRKFSGEASFGADMLERPSILITIDDAASIEVTGNINDKDRQEIERRMRDEVLEVDRFPSIVYRCDRLSGNGNGGQYWVTLQGDLSLHGVTRQQNVSTSVFLAENSLRASGSFSVKQTDFDIELISALGGAIRVKDEVKFSFDIVARKVE
jgi:polyisoprenoid-binding protein YceI